MDINLLEFKRILEDRLTFLQKIIKATTSDAIEISMTNANDNAEITSLSRQLKFNESILGRYHNEVSDIIISLKKIEDGTYGVCEMCDQKININRLRSKPHAKFCTVCREMYEKSSGKVVI